VLIVRFPDRLLSWLTAIASRRKAEVGGGIPAAFTGTLIADGYAGYQHLFWPEGLCGSLTLGFSAHGQ
jgi:hypothetical protein